jgi:3-oxoacyl-[acyl-carrier-protein] synthase II
MMNNAYIVGYGIIDALGNNPRDCFSHLLDSNEYLSDIPNINGIDITKGYIVNEELITQLPNLPRLLTKTQRLGFHAVDQALAMANLPKSKNVAVIFSTILNDVETLDEMYPRLIDNKRLQPRKILNRIPDMLASHIAQYYQFMGTSLGIFAACASGISSIDYAMRLLDEYDYVIVGGSDAGCNSFAIKYFNALGAVGNHSCPFDDGRTGFVMGEGAAALILQSKKKVEEYNSKVYATLYPAGIANDAYDATSPAEDGRGAIMAIEKSLQHVVGPIHAINAHATSTPIGDIVEYNVVTERFGNTPIYAPKSKIGHTMAASGIIETIYAIESMSNGIIPHIHNLESSNFDTTNCLVKDNTVFHQTDTLRTLNNSFGFGGKCASQVIELTKI